MSRPDLCFMHGRPESSDHPGSGNKFLKKSTHFHGWYGTYIRDATGRLPRRDEPLISMASMVPSCARAVTDTPLPGGVDGLVMETVDAEAWNLRICCGSGSRVLCGSDG